MSVSLVFPCNTYVQTANIFNKLLTKQVGSNETILPFINISCEINYGFIIRTEHV